MGMEMGGKGGMCPCPHHKVVPIGMACAIILFGASFLLANVGFISARAAGVLWPVAIILMGVLKLGKVTCVCCKSQHAGMM